MGRELRVVGAVIIRDGRVLCARRGPDGSLAGLWEFPGGKIEPNESPANALVREIREELECEIDVRDEQTLTTHEYDFGVIHLTTFYCDLIGGTPRPNEHSALEWKLPTELDDLNWAPADIPAVEIIKRDFS